MGAIRLATSNSTDEEYGGIIEEKYSATEQVVGKWIDGSTLYRKVIEVSSASSGGQTIPHGISNLKNVVSLNGIMTAFGTEYSLPTISDQAANRVAYGNVNNTDINISVGANVYSSVTRITTILEYTKTTS